jgi:hypothetical protein
LLGTSLGGCIFEIPTPTLDLSKGNDRMPVDETGPWTYRDPTEKELLLARSDFSVEIIRFTDSRRPRSMELSGGDQMIYNYDPDVLLGGTTYQVPGMLGKYLSYRPKMPKHYKVEIDLKRLNTVIKAGTFWSGSWGRYHVDYVIDVIARRPDSTIALKKTFTYSVDQPREDTNGRGPTKERDRARMFDLTESMLRKGAEDIGWNLRMRDARIWKAPAPATIPTRLNIPPAELKPRASGTSDADTAPATLQPVIVPSAPASGWMDGPKPVDNGTPAPDLMPDDEVPTEMVPGDAAMGPVI